MLNFLFFLCNIVKCASVETEENSINPNKSTTSRFGEPTNKIAMNSDKMNPGQQGGAEKMPKPNGGDNKNQNLPGKGPNNAPAMNMPNKNGGGAKNQNLPGKGPNNAPAMNMPNNNGGGSENNEANAEPAPGNSAEAVE
ncbi:hypothetical protein GVAV_001058 [Gurleya vavrai]